MGGEMMDEVDDFFAHYGVKGMKWGKRNSKTGEPKPKMSREKKLAITAGVGATVAVGAAVAFHLMGGSKPGTSHALDIPVQTLSTNKTMLAGKSNLIFNAASAAKADRTSPINIPVQTLTTNRTMLAGKSNLIFNAASMAANAPKPRSDIADIPVAKLTTNKTMLAGKANLIFNAAAMSAAVPPAPKQGLVDKAKEKAFDTAKTAAVNKLQKTTYDDFKAMNNPQPRSGIKAKATGAVKDKTNEIIIKKVRDVSTAKANQIDASKGKRWPNR
jgi:hypothetical protein